MIDVGYAGVIGAHQIVHGITPYGTFPASCGHCDTYGPLTYMAVVPFEVVSPWHGTWDSLPAAHAAATAFDLLCVAGLLALGWRLGGFRLGVALATAWAAFPFTAYALESNTNDALVAAMLIWGLVVRGAPDGPRPDARPGHRGEALAGDPASRSGGDIRTRAGEPRHGWLWFAAGLAIAAVLTGWVILLDGLGGIHTSGPARVSYQLGRQTPFSIWGQYPGLRPVQTGAHCRRRGRGCGMLRWPRERDLLTLAALSGTLMIGLQLTLNYWFYLYIPWFLPFVLVATVPDWPRPLPVTPPPAPDAGDGVAIAEAAAG